MTTEVLERTKVEEGTTAKETLLKAPAPDLSTRKAKLMYVADLVQRLGAAGDMQLFHNLEHCTPEQLISHPNFNMTERLAIANDSTNPDSVHYKDHIARNVFCLIAGDQNLQEAGAGMTIGSQATFLGLGVSELHEFSCDCGGSVSKDEMTRRITALSEGQPTSFNPVQQQQAGPAPFLDRVRNYFG